jgi:outer membrane protein OmpA-like peptidoglycan-associated protein
MASNSFGSLIHTLAIVPLVAGTMVFWGGDSAALAQSQSLEKKIMDALKPAAKPLRRGLVRSLRDPKGAEKRSLINRLRGRTARAISVEEREKVAEIAKTKPHIDLEINFDYDSAEIGPKAVPALVALGRALSKDGFKGTVFLINGHTDAKGSGDYNQGLSERRAEAVKRTLVEQFDLPPTTLIAIGYGKTHLKNTANPFAAENRRVQIVNTEVK